jgi:hypothetical protein
MRFTIRDLLWLTVVVALGVAWWLDRGRLLSRVERAERTAEFVTLLYTHPPGPFIADKPLPDTSALAPNSPKK